MSLILQPPDLRLWQRFQNGGCTEQEIQSSLVLQRWQRCREAGLPADGPGEPAMALSGLAETVNSFSEVLAPGAPFDAFAAEVAKAGYCGLFCDGRGVVLSRRIAEPFRDSIAEVRLVEGALWSESARGTNGMGTSLMERRPVAVVGAEHYELRNHGLACYAAPVRDVRERIVAVLDATGPMTSAAGFVHAAVVATASAIEALIVARTYDAASRGGLFEIERQIALLPHAALVIEETGRVRRANARSKTLSQAARVDLTRLVRAHMATDPGLKRPLTSDLPASMRGLSIELEPIGRRDEPFAVLVHLRPRYSRLTGVRDQDNMPEAFKTIVGSDPAVVAARRQAARFAPTDLPILLLAETGAGKEIFARAIHDGGPRRAMPFIAVNCGALSGTLLESELFGYGPGSFTGAAPSGRMGKLAAAHRGTLFLDEVGEMSPAAQAALLRFLEDGTYYRVGEDYERRADVRLIAATSLSLPDLVSAGSFRSDLYFRMRGVVLRLPALRDRSDRHELALALLERIARARKQPGPLRVSPAAQAWIERHGWPGNVRELRSTLEYAVVLAGSGDTVELWHLPIEEAPEPQPQTDLRAAAERAALVDALNRAKGNLSDAARAMGVARSTLYRMLERYHLRPDRKREAQ